MITIHGMADSGNCYKPRLLCALLEIPFRHVETSSRDGTTRTAEFLAVNPIGKVPALVLPDGRALPESNAILFHLGEGTRFVPEDRFERSSMLAWMFFEQYSHEPTIAVRRSLLCYPERRARATPERLAETLAGGEAAFAVMEKRLGAAPWLVANGPSLADIALYPYTASAPEGGYDLSPFPGIRAWLARIEALPGYRPRDWLPEG